MANHDIMLAPGEQGVYQQLFSPNLLLFWMKTSLSITNRRVVARHPNTIFGVIPLGYNETSMPISAIAQVNTSLTVKPARLIVFGILAIGCIFMGIGNLGSAMGIALLLFGVWFTLMAANGIFSQLSLLNQGGGVNSIVVSALEQGKLEQFKSKTNEYIYSRMQ